MNDTLHSRLVSEAYLATPSPSVPTHTPYSGQVSVLYRSSSVNTHCGQYT